MAGKRQLPTQGSPPSNRGQLLRAHCAHLGSHFTGLAGKGQVGAVPGHAASNPAYGIRPSRKRPRIQMFWGVCMFLSNRGEWQRAHCAHPGYNSEGLAGKEQVGAASGEVDSSPPRVKDPSRQKSAPLPSRYQNKPSRQGSWQPASSLILLVAHRQELPPVCQPDINNNVKTRIMPSISQPDTFGSPQQESCAHPTRYCQEPDPKHLSGR